MRHIAKSAGEAISHADCRACPFSERTHARITPTCEPMQKTPEQWLEEAAPQKRQGIFKVFLGYAPGVGKTYSMLSEGIRRKSRGEDVVIGLAETHGRKGIAELATKLETVPRRQM